MGVLFKSSKEIKKNRNEHLHSIVLEGKQNHQSRLQEKNMRKMIWESQPSEVLNVWRKRRTCIFLVIPVVILVTYIKFFYGVIAAAAFSLIGCLFFGLVRKDSTMFFMPLICSISGVFIGFIVSCYARFIFS